MSITLTAYKSGKFRFIWGFDSVAEAKRLGMQFMRTGRGRDVQVHRGTKLIWCRGVAKMPQKNTTT
jgi:hypothetical protein